MRANMQASSRPASVAARRLRGFSLVALGLMASLAAPSAHAQSCALCYTSVAGGGPTVIRAFMLGILTLLIPVLLLFSAIFFTIYRRSRAADQQSARPVAREAVHTAVRVTPRPANGIRGTLPTTAS